MVSRNNITGDRLINKRLSKEGEDNWDRIFKKQGITLTEEELANVEIIADIVQHHHDNKTILKEDPIKKPFPHNILRQPCVPEYELDKSTGEVIKKYENT
jgi:hypothetical protein